MLSHLTYQVAVSHRDELLREATNQRRSTRAVSGSGTQALSLIRRVRRRRIALSRLWVAGQS
jgi:hypothetical protein